MRSHTVAYGRQRPPAGAHHGQARSNCGKTAINCMKLREIAKIATLNPPPPTPAMRGCETCRKKGWQVSTGQCLQSRVCAADQFPNIQLVLWEYCAPPHPPSLLRDTTAGPRSTSRLRGTAASRAAVLSVGETIKTDQLGSVRSLQSGRRADGSAAAGAHRGPVGRAVVVSRPHHHRKADGPWASLSPEYRGLDPSSGSEGLYRK